jgi:hypothetical protein
VQPFQTLFNLNLQLLTGLRETAKYLQIRASRTNHGLGSWAELKPSLLCRFRSEAIFSTRKPRSQWRLQGLFCLGSKRNNFGPRICPARFPRQLLRCSQYEPACQGCEFLILSPWRTNWPPQFEHSALDLFEGEA